MTDEAPGWMKVHLAAADIALVLSTRPDCGRGVCVGCSRMRDGSYAVVAVLAGNRHEIRQMPMCDDCAFKYEVKRYCDFNPMTTIPDYLPDGFSARSNGE